MKKYHFGKTHIKNLDEKVKKMKEYFGDSLRIKPSIGNLMKFFKNDFNENVICGRIWIDLSQLMTYGSNAKVMRKRFDNQFWQRAFITYFRKDVVFYKYENYPDYEEEWFSTKDLIWPDIVYLRDVNIRDLFQKKIARLYEKKWDELYVQIHSFDIDDMNGKINVNKEYVDQLYKDWKNFEDEMFNKK